jgi:hypothetical protein
MLEPLVLPPQPQPVLTGETFARPWYLFLDAVQRYASSGAQLARYGLRAARIAANMAGLVDGTLWTETDTGLVYQWRTASKPLAWSYAAGVYARTQAQLAALAATLKASDSGLLVNVTDYAHVLQWTGAAWSWGPGEQGSGMLEAFAVAPTGSGWHVCDGSAGVKYLKSDGTTGTVTLPNTAGSAAYLLLGPAYSATITAAVVPTISTPAITVANATLTTAANFAATGAATAVTQAVHGHTATSSTPTATLPGDPVANFSSPLYFRQ